MFLSANASKRSLACSLRDPRGREALLRLVDGADVFLQSLRPGLAERLGLGSDELRARNARLVYCSVGAYGSVGPQRDEPGYDALMQAAGGLISLTGEPGRPGVRVGSSLIDQGTGTWAALGILAALFERETTGAGRLVDVSLYETALGYIGYHLAGYLADGTVPRGHGTGFPGIAPYEVIRTRDGELMVAAGNDRLFLLLCGELGADDLTIDPRFRTNPDRVANREALISLLEPHFAAGRHGLLARAAHRRGRAGRAGRRHRGHPRLAANGGARDHAAPPPPRNPGPPIAGAAAVARRRPRRAPKRAAAPRRAHRRDPARGGVRRRGDRRRWRKRASSTSPKPSNRLLLGREAAGAVDAAR